MRHVVLIAAAILATSPAWADDSNTAKWIGWGIGCGCSRTDVDTMIKHLDRFFFPDASEAELKSLAGYVKHGERESRKYDNSDQICSDLCYKFGDTFKTLDDDIEAVVAALPPASAPTEQDARAFDGEWDLEFWVEDFFPSGLKTRIKVTNDKFTVPIKSARANGRIQGEILSDGMLVGSGELRGVGYWRGTIFTFSTPFRDEVFSANGHLKGWSGGQQYRITLTRATQTQLTPPE